MTLLEPQLIQNIRNRFRKDYSSFRRI